MHDIIHLHEQAQKKLENNHPKAWKTLAQTEIPIEHFVHTTTKIVTTAALASTLVAPIPRSSTVIPLETEGTPAVITETTPIAEPTSPAIVSTDTVLQQSLIKTLPQDIGKLSPQTSQEVSQRISSTLNIHAYTSLDGNELNTDYGYMGAEQHLPRFPGDTVAQHDEYQIKGITPKTGAFSYFVPSQAQLTDEVIQQEKYYMAVQTFYAPQWNNNAIAYKNWIKFRKVLVINPHNGKAIVAVVGDAGPAKWTGKHFGGSPEVVHYLNEGSHRAKTTVVLLFVDDPGNQIPLGPIT